MQTQDENSSIEKKKVTKNSHSSHLKMMAICCGIPVLGFLVIGGMGISAPSLETLLFLACPIGMGYMMYKMRKKHGAQEKSCCSSEGETQESLETGSQSENPVKAVNSLPAESTVSVKTS